MEDIFMFDIETTGQYRNIEELKINDIRGYNLFSQKYIKYNWVDKYETLENAYLEESPIISTYGRITCISFGYLDNGIERVLSFYGNDEKEIVEKFNNLLKKIETKNFKLGGYRILYFDIPWILHKLHKYGIKPASIITLHNKKPWETRIVDISDDWKIRFAYTSSFDEVTYELGLESPKDNMNGSDVHVAFWDGRVEEVKTYCEKDVTSCIRVAQKIY